jgi:hypothetical protein
MESGFAWKGLHHGAKTTTALYESTMRLYKGMHRIIIVWTIGKYDEYTKQISECEYK